MGSPRTPKTEDLPTIGQVASLIEGVGGDSVELRNQAIAQAVSPLASKTELTQATTGLASTTALTMVAQAIPSFSSDTPRAETPAGAVGNMGKVPHADHQHPRLTSSTAGTTGADGTATLAFTRSFATLPGVVLTAIENNTSAGPSLKVMKWKTKNAQGQLVDRSTAQGSTESYDGCVVYAWRGRALPTQQPISVVSLLTGVITGLNNLIGALSGYEPYVAASNVAFTFIAVQSSAS